MLPRDEDEMDLMVHLLSSAAAAAAFKSPLQLNELFCT